MFRVFLLHLLQGNTKYMKKHKKKPSGVSEIQSCSPRRAGGCGDMLCYLWASKEQYGTSRNAWCFVLLEKSLELLVMLLTVKSHKPSSP